MKRPIRLFWYVRKSGAPNFGDDLSCEIVRAITGRDVEYSPAYRCDLVAIGSVLQNFTKARKTVRQKLHNSFFRDKLRVWGSGFRESEKLSRHLFEVLALRGPKSQECFGVKDRIPLGDPALLVRHLFPPLHSKNRPIGIVPHYVDKSCGVISQLKNDSRYKIIDVERSARDVVAEISSCSAVLSSSLHGLIVSDAYEIPNVRVSFSQKIKGGDFKFDDYAMAIGRSEISSRQVNNVDQVDDIVKNLSNYGASKPSVDLDQLCVVLESSLQDGI